jgi:hypothetical protein
MIGIRNSGGIFRIWRERRIAMKPSGSSARLARKKAMKIA